ncbi:hypothetical protein [Pseudochrobactrum kiredjianiae]|uniref:Uncharacterized protein n=1 Tax=Pseudochrobactrum kiredjianiae TaxID=386305 RepID=A0ABW3V0I1_9HYPH|nr:hypothetical protein [Pseudochrobactrum kiredjianiae]MDM7852686.1 hypothetical protein [Pseudochrobactrum kiredjianiae]
MKKLFCGILGVALFASMSPANAQQYKLKALGDASVIFVWNSADDRSEGYKLIQAGVHKTSPQLLMPLIACVAKPGNKVIVTDMGFVTHDIMVVDGENVGCRGNIAAEELGR